MIPKAPFGNTVFCDDVREEIGGKHSFMGVYAANIRVPALPATLAKFAFGVRYFHAIDDLREPVILRVFGPGEDGAEAVFFEAKLPVTEARQNVSSPSEPLEDEETPLISMMANVVLSPFPLFRTGRLKVRVYVGPEADEIRLGSLVIEHAPPKEPPSEAVP